MQIKKLHSFLAISILITILLTAFSIYKEMYYRDIGCNVFCREARSISVLDNRVIYLLAYPTVAPVYVAQIISNGVRCITPDHTYTITSLIISSILIYGFLISIASLLIYKNKDWGYLLLLLILYMFLTYLLVGLFPDCYTGPPYA